MRKVKDAVDLTTNEKIYFKGHAKATYLSDGRNVEDALGEIPSGESSVFKAVYGETTYDEIVEAHNNGKIVICEYDVWVCRLTKIQASQVMFQASADNSVTRLTCNTKGQWSVGTSSTAHNLKQLDNGNVEITISTKTAEVATPAYVSDAIASAITNVLNEEV